MNENPIETPSRPYGEIYRLLCGNFRSAETPIVEPKAGELPRLFRRLGAIPKSWNRRQADAATEQIIRQMAREHAVPAEEVRTTLAAFCSDESPKHVCGSLPTCAECPLDEYCAYPERRLTIKDLPENQRPRERLLDAGEEGLSDVELLAIIIGGGSSRGTALDLASRLLSKFGSFRRLSQCGIAELTDVHGIGAAKAARIKAALAIARRYSAQRMPPGVPITGSERVAAYMEEKLAGLQKECFFCLLLDTKNQLIREQKVAMGSLSESVVHPREVFKTAISESASKVIFVHNHPSGNPAPSAQDRRLTTRLCKAGALLGIPVLDHIIVGSGSYFSFAEKKLL